MPKTLTSHDGILKFARSINQKMPGYAPIRNLLDDYAKHDPSRDKMAFGSGVIAERNAEMREKLIARLGEALLAMPDSYWPSA